MHQVRALVFISVFFGPFCLFFMRLQKAHSVHNAREDTYERRRGHMVYARRMRTARPVPWDVAVSKQERLTHSPVSSARVGGIGYRVLFFVEHDIRFHLFFSVWSFWVVPLFSKSQNLEIVNGSKSKPFKNHNMKRLWSWASGRAGPPGHGRVGTGVGVDAKVATFSRATRARPVTDW